MQAPDQMDTMSEVSVPLSAFSEDEQYQPAPRTVLVTKDTPALMEPAPQHSTAALVIGIVWAVAVAIGGMVVGMTSRLTGSKALKTPTGQNYYDIVRPGIAPSPPAFVIIWTALFLSFGAGGVAMILPWIMRGVSKTNAQETARLSIGVSLYVIILGLLYAWMPVFANKEQPRQAAFLLIAMLVLYVPLLFISFATSWWSSALLAPLFGWLVVALVMNSDSVNKWCAYNKKCSRQSIESTVAKVMSVQPGHAIDLDDEPKEDHASGRGGGGHGGGGGGGRAALGMGAQARALAPFSQEQGNASFAMMPQSQTFADESQMPTATIQPSTVPSTMMNPSNVSVQENIRLHAMQRAQQQREQVRREMSQTPLQANSLEAAQRSVPRDSLDTSHIEQVSGAQGREVPRSLQDQVQRTQNTTVSGVQYQPRPVPLVDNTKPQMIEL